MKVKHEKITNNIKMLMIMDIDIEDNQDEKKLIMILSKLTRGEKYYFQFRREDDDFLSYEEIIKYRYEIPQYFQIYEIKELTDERRFDSIGCLTMDKHIYKQIIIFWKYFYGLLFFNPVTSFSWHEYSNIWNKIKPELYGIGIIQNNYANSVFIKGHDGDNLIFAYGPNYEETIVNEVVEDIVKNR